MNLKDRRKQIVDILSKSGYATVDSLAKALDVSVVTIRSDLSGLEEERLVIRTHGGAMKHDSKSTPRCISDTIAEKSEQKKLIAGAASALVADNDIVILDSGSTNVFLASFLKEKKITVITNSIPVAEMYAWDESKQLIVLGGSLRRSTMGTIGPLANTAVSAMNADLFFLGAAAYGAEGISSSDMTESELKRAMIHSANKVVFIADSSKFGKKAFSAVCSWDSIDTFVTDSIDENFKQSLEEKGIEVIIPEF